MTSKPLAILYEHPDWFRPLFAELDSRGINYVKLDPSCHSYDPASAARDFSLFFNRMSASAYLRGNGQGIFFTHNYLAHLEASGVRVLNGSQAFAVETSKARQLQLFHSLGLSFPKTRVVNYTDEILAAAPQIGFPLLVKPNIGGRGAGIVRFDSIEQLHAAMISIRRRLQISLGQQGTGMRQGMCFQRQAFPKPGLELRVLRVDVHGHDAHRRPSINLLEPLQNRAQKAFPSFGLSHVVNGKNHYRFDAVFTNPLRSCQLRESSPDVKRVVSIQVG